MNWINIAIFAAMLFTAIGVLLVCFRNALTQNSAAIKRVALPAVKVLIMVALTVAYVRSMKILPDFTAWLGFFSFCLLSARNLSAWWVPKRKATVREEMMRLPMTLNEFSPNGMEFSFDHDIEAHFYVDPTKANDFFKGHDVWVGDKMDLLIMREPKEDSKLDKN